jgi:hypothetical protein
MSKKEVVITDLINGLMALEPADLSYILKQASLITATRFYVGTDALPMDAENSDEYLRLSDYVLIDVDGKRETFVVGRVHFNYAETGELTSKWWVVPDDLREYVQDPETVRWTFLDLAKYDKK